MAPYELDHRAKFTFFATTDIVKQDWYRRFEKSISVLKNLPVHF